MHAAAKAASYAERRRQIFLAIKVFGSAKGVFLLLKSASRLWRVIPIEKKQLEITSRRD
jgi:hypothetical protein